MSDRQSGVLLACFDGDKAAARARRPLDQRLRSHGDLVLDSVVLRVDAKHKVSVCDPRRVLAGALTATLTWGLFGLVTGSGALGIAISAVLGAAYGGWFAYSTEHALRKAQLVHLGARLRSQSSALLTFAETSDPRGILRAAAVDAPAVASVAAIADDLTARVFAGAADPGDVPPGAADRALPPAQTALLSMILLRYRDLGTARQVAARLAAGSEQAVSTPQVELVIETDRGGRRHVADPGHGVGAEAKSEVVSWGGLGLIVGAIGGVAGGGILGVLGNALLTGVAWGACGLVAGALYGLWAGRATSARRLRGIAPLLAPGTSTLLAWADGPVSQETIDALSAPESQRLVLRFNPVEGGAVLEAT